MSERLEGESSLRPVGASAPGPGPDLRGAGIREGDRRETGVGSGRRPFLRRRDDSGSGASASRKSDRWRPGARALAAASALAIAGWGAFAVVLASGNWAGQGDPGMVATPESAAYASRLDELGEERDARAREALAALDRFDDALEQATGIQSKLLDSETRRMELEGVVGALRASLATARQDLDDSRTALATLEARVATAGAEAPEITAARLELISDTFALVASEREELSHTAGAALARQKELEHEILLMQERNDRIFEQLEEAVSISVEPLERMFRSAGIEPDRILETVRRGYSGMGGRLETPGEAGAVPGGALGDEEDHSSADILRADRILARLDELLLYRIATEQVPFAHPLRSRSRFVSGYGMRNDPFTGHRRMHRGADFAAPTGTNVYATADGTVTMAGRDGGLGKVVKIRHALGLETVYAHNTRLLVKRGEKVSRGQHIADMGSTGRSTGPHLHYEIRANGRATNPMTYIKAARDVF